MTNDEMIKWAGFELPSRTIGSADADWNAVKVQDTYDCLDKLIWMAKAQQRADLWRQIASHANTQHILDSVSSYPGGLKNKKNSAPQGVDSGS